MFSFINKTISFKTTIIRFRVISKVMLYVRTYVTMTQPSVRALGAVVRSSSKVVFFPSVVPSTFYMAQNQAVRKPDGASRKCSDVNQPRVQGRKADSPKRPFKPGQTVSL